MTLRFMPSWEKSLPASSQAARRQNRSQSLGASASRFKTWLRAGWLTRRPGDATGTEHQSSELNNDSVVLLSFNYLLKAYELIP